MIQEELPMRTFFFHSCYLNHSPCPSATVQELIEGWVTGAAEQVS